VSRHPFSQFLERKYLEWQIDVGKRISQAEFAKLIGISRASLTMWMNGDHLPDRENAGKLASFFGPEVFDVLNLPRPDPDLQTLSRLWPNLPAETRHAIREQAEKYVTDKERIIS